MEEAGRASVGPGNASDRAGMVSEEAGRVSDRAGRVSEEVGSGTEGATRALGEGDGERKKKKQITEYFPKCGGTTGHFSLWVHCPKTQNND